MFLLGAILDRFFCEYVGAQPLHADRHPHHRARRDHALAGAHRACGGRCEAASTRSGRSPGASTSSPCCGASSAATRTGRGSATAPRAARSIVALGQDPFLDFPASNLSKFEREAARPLPRVREIPRAARAAGRAAAGDDRGSAWLELDARRRLSALSRHSQSSLPAAVLPRLGGRPADRHSTTARRPTASSPMSAR